MLFRSERKMEKLTLIQNDPWLKPYSDAIEGRYHRVIEKEKTLTCGFFYLKGVYVVKDQLD